MALLGDSAHAMQPNLGQGGCMAIEDAYELAIDLSRAVSDKAGNAAAVDVEGVLRSYQDSRILRVSAIHGMAGESCNQRSRAGLLWAGSGWVGRTWAASVCAV